MRLSQKSFLAQSPRWFLVLAEAQVLSRAYGHTSVCLRVETRIRLDLGPKF